MKNLIIFVIILITAAFLLSRTALFAQVTTGTGTTPDTDQKTEQHDTVNQVLDSIMQTQHVSSVDQIDKSKITDNQWDGLGDAVMDQVHPGSTHDFMDRMMGGDGSRTLRTMHINMGKIYLGFYDSAHQEQSDATGPSTESTDNDHDGRMGPGMMYGY